MTLRHAVQHVVWRLREELYPEKHPYDILTGCDTSGMIHHSRLGSEATDYQPVDPDVFRATLAHVVNHASGDLSQFTFVDLGCGKGRALLLAEECAFKKIVGVDLAKALVETSLRNAAAVGSKRITVVHGDAREFGFPPGPLVVFLYNPFSAQITRSVMQRLSGHPDTFYVAYVNPLHAEAISSLPGAEIVAKDDWCTIWRFRALVQASSIEPIGTTSSVSGMP
jgi:SAM-dependent methyltransferase